MQNIEIKDDMLFGAAAIARFLGIPVRKIYSLRENPRVTIPIWSEAGFGLVSSKSKLLGWRDSRTPNSRIDGA